MIDQQQLKTELLLKEYETVKAEQTARVGFRDNLLYVTLTLFGGILAYAVSGINFLALLILPWVCLIMGWTYLVKMKKFRHWGDMCAISFLMASLRRWILMKIPLK